MSSPSVFRSSPPRPPTFNSTSVLSSSPCLPSLDEIFLKKSPRKPPLGAGKAGVLPTLTGAANVLREAPVIDIDTETIIPSPSHEARRKTTSRRRGAPIPDTLADDRGSNSPATVIESLSPKDKPWQKFKSKPTENDNESLIPRSPKVSNSKKRSGKAIEKVSRHFTTSEEGSRLNSSAEREKRKLSTKEQASAVLASVALEPAIPRRGDWTPPRADVPIVLDSDSDTRELLSSVGKEPVSKDVFQTLYNQYGRQDTDLAPELFPQAQADFLRKRKRIELVSTGQERGGEQPHEEPLSKEPQLLNEQKTQAKLKAPAPRKKTRTITELATAPFAVPPASDIELTGPTTKESMLDYFDSDGAVKALVEHQTAVMSQRKTKGKEKKQPAKTKRKKKAGTEADPILLSPSTALKQSSKQDFVFGTSSQLVQEESPATLRDLQAAIRASNSLNSDPFDDDVGQRLWHAGARDEEGELIGMEFIDLQHGPAVVTEPDLTVTPGCRSFVDIDDILDSPKPVSSTLNAPSAPLQTNPHFVESQNTEQSSSSQCSEPGGSASASNLDPRPNYELFTDAQLGKQITSYGFKPMKRRAAMIALLDQCWTSKHQGASAGSIQPLSTSTRTPVLAQQEPTGNVPNEASARTRGRNRATKDGDSTTSVAKPTTSKTSTPKRPRGRPKKDEAASTSAAGSGVSVSSPKRPRSRPRKSSAASIEIPDSETGTPSPVLSSADPVFSSPPPLDLTTLDEGDLSLTLSPTDQQTELFRHITKAVTSAPRSQNPSNPSWYEKMLLYDPIILEDLASWLNGGELTRVGYDGEVSPFDVKTWCESKSVICLWRQNLRGRERKRL
ncbi:hypothetical protein F5X98DRAFT_325429 [Xylaria grammica]|nr:hypothetical protein F5X98DRAFT_325429 [Xylaria grammica]